MFRVEGHTQLHSDYHDYATSHTVSADVLIVSVERFFCNGNIAE